MPPVYMQRIDTFVSELATHIPAPRGVSNRSKAMLTCYPGDGARYVKHTDNHCRLGKGDRCNGRRLTTLLYLNEGWVPRDGGQLRLYGGPEGKTKLRDVEPILDRLVLFWSDFRVPHEVLPATKDRYASTIWYFDKTERERALAAGVTDTNDGRTTGRVKDASEAGKDKTRERAERERIEREIAKFEDQFGGKATVIDAEIAHRNWSSRGCE